MFPHLKALAVLLQTHAFPALAATLVRGHGALGGGVVALKEDTGINEKKPCQQTQ